MNQMIGSIFNLPGWLIAAISLTAVALLMMYSSHVGNKSYEKTLAYLTEDEQHIGEKIEIGFVKIIEIDDNQTTALDSRARSYYLLINSNSKLIQGETYSFIGQLTGEGKIKVLKIQHHPYRFYKYLLSSLSIIPVLFIIIKCIRFDSSGLYIKTNQKLFEMDET